MRDLGLNEYEAAEQIEKIISQLNEELNKDLCFIAKKDGKYHLVNIDEDQELIGEGGFADVYYQKSTGLVFKKLKDEYLSTK